MNPELPRTPREELEASLTALLLGELPPERAFALGRVLEHDAELAVLYERLKLAAELVRETGANPAEKTETQPPSMKLSDTRRQALLQQFKTIKPKQFVRPQKRKNSWLVPLSVAAAFTVFAAVSISTMTYLKFGSPVTLGSGGMLGRELAAPSAAPAPPEGTTFTVMSGNVQREARENDDRNYLTHRARSDQARNYAPNLSAGGGEGSERSVPAKQDQSKLAFKTWGLNSGQNHQMAGTSGDRNSAQTADRSAPATATLLRAEVAQKAEAARLSDQVQAGALAVKADPAPVAKPQVAVVLPRGEAAAASGAVLGKQEQNDLALNLAPAETQAGLVASDSKKWEVNANLRGFYSDKAPEVVAPGTFLKSQRSQDSEAAAVKKVENSGQLQDGLADPANASTRSPATLSWGFDAGQKAKQSLPALDSSGDKRSEFMFQVAEGRAPDSLNKDDMSRHYGSYKVQESAQAEPKPAAMPPAASPPPPAGLTEKAQFAGDIGGPMGGGMDLPASTAGGRGLTELKAEAAGNAVESEAAFRGRYGSATGGSGGGGGGGMGGGGGQRLAASVPSVSSERTATSSGDSVVNHVVNADPQEVNGELAKLFSERERRMVASQTPPVVIGGVVATNGLAYSSALNGLRYTSEEFHRLAGVGGQQNKQEGLGLPGPSVTFANPSHPAKALVVLPTEPAPGAPKPSLATSENQTADRGFLAAQSEVRKPSQQEQRLGLENDKNPPLAKDGDEKSKLLMGENVTKADAESEHNSLSIVGYADIGTSHEPHGSYYLTTATNMAVGDYYFSTGTLRDDTGGIRKETQLPKVNAPTNGTSSSVEEKLGRLRFDAVNYDRLPLSAVLQTLNEETRKLDPEKRGVNLLVDSSSRPGRGDQAGVDPTTGLPTPAAPASPDIASVEVKFPNLLKNASLSNVLDAVVKSAEVPIKYSVESNGVVFSIDQEELGRQKEQAKQVAARAAAGVPQPEVETSENMFSTFSLNVSDVSFKLAAASLEQGKMPELGNLRSEEFINAFDYRDPEPPAGVPVVFAWERAAYPFAQNRDLLRFSIKTAALGRTPGRPMNIVLLLDNSGSMERADRVNITREALRVLAAQLQPQDKFSVVTFARTARLWVDGIPGNQAGQVAEEIGKLTPQGGTNLEEAMNLAYATALRHYLAGGVNRVVMLTDGAANLGTVDPETLKQKVETNRVQGIALDCFGVGWEGYNDDLLEQLTRHGDGRYGFLNSPEEAATEFAGQLAGALHVAASDVKVQVEFNPSRVTAYRQIGYAKHQLTKEQFRDNTVDAAEIGAAESGNALYVIAVNPRGSGPLATVRVRYRVPGTMEYHEHEWVAPYTGNAVALENASPAMRLAATASAFSEWLAASPYATEVTPDRLLVYLRGVPEVCGADARPKKLEWMIRQAKSISGK
jgi:Mg-chelatase subunit ChlD